MHRRSLLTVLLLCTAPLALHAQDAAEPAAEDIQRLVRASYVRQNMSLKGQLRNDSTGAEAPFVLSMLDNTIRFRFDNPTQILNLDLNDKGFILREVVKDKNAPVPKAKYAEKVRGTDVTYEDISMRFLYWPNPVRLENEVLNQRTCWKLRLNNPDQSGSYGVAYIWVDKTSGSIMQMEGYDRDGKLIKRYKIISGMKVGDGWMLKQLRVESFEPGTQKRIGRTYLELEK